MDCGSKMFCTDEAAEMVRKLSRLHRVLTETFTGVYFSQDASVSLGSYAGPSSMMWKNSVTKPTTCCTLAEIINRRNEFVSAAQSFLVVNKTEWIMWLAYILRFWHLSGAHLVNSRYLLVLTATKAKPDGEDFSPSFVSQPMATEEPMVGKYLVQEQGFSTRFGSTSIDVPQPSYQLDKLVGRCVLGRKEVTLEPEDRAIFDGPKEETHISAAASSSAVDTNAGPDNTHMLRSAGRVWEPDSKWIQRNAQELLPPPMEASHAASSALQREFRAIMREQNAALAQNDLATLGWYLPPRHNEDNLYQWLVELHSFDPELPIAKDMKSE